MIREELKKRIAKLTKFLEDADANTFEGAVINERFTLDENYEELPVPTQEEIIDADYRGCGR